MSTAQAGGLLIALIAAAVWIPWLLRNPLVHMIWTVLGVIAVLVIANMPGGPGAVG